MKRKGLFMALAASLIFLVTASQTMAQGVTLPDGSQEGTVTQRVGITYISVNYHRPSVNDREIWGALVPYGFSPNNFGTAKEIPWRAGANENTVISFSSDVKVEGQDLDAGKYGLHMVPQESGDVMVIFSKNSSSWGSFFYSQDEDALRVTVKSVEAPMTEVLTFDFAEISVNSAVASLVWEKKRIPFKVEVDNKAVIVASLKDELRGSPGFTWQNFNAAANYCLQNDTDLELGLQWADASIAAPFIGNKNFTNLSTKAQILGKMDKTEESQKVMDEALPMGTTFQIHAYGRQLIGQGQFDKALEVFEWNAKANPDQWPVNYGLARGYSAKGDYKNALKYLKKAQVPENDTINKQAVEANIKKLESDEDIN